MLLYNEARRSVPTQAHVIVCWNRRLQRVWLWRDIGYNVWNTSNHRAKYVRLLRTGCYIFPIMYVQRTYKFGSTCSLGFANNTHILSFILLICNTVVFWYYVCTNTISTSYGSRVNKTTVSCVLTGYNGRSF